MFFQQLNRDEIGAKTVDLNIFESLKILGSFYDNFSSMNYRLNDYSFSMLFPQYIVHTTFYVILLYETMQF